MSWQWDDNHEPQIHRRSTGWRRWWADCSCGWRWEEGGSKLAAMLEADAHAFPRTPPSTYDSRTMEYGP